MFILTVQQIRYKILSVVALLRYTVLMVLRCNIVICTAFYTVYARFTHSRLLTQFTFKLMLRHPFQQLLRPTDKVTVR